MQERAEEEFIYPSQPHTNIDIFDADFQSLSTRVQIAMPVDISGFHLHF